MNMRIWAAIHDRWILFVQRVVVGTRLVFKVHWEFRAGFRFAITCVCAFERYMNRLEVPRSPAVLFIWPIYVLLVECLIFIASNPDSCALNFLNLRWNPQFRGLRVSVGHFFVGYCQGFKPVTPKTIIALSCTVLCFGTQFETMNRDIWHTEENKIMVMGWYDGIT